MSETARRRHRVSRNTGQFLLAEDLRLRGGGELLRTRQSGDTPFRCGDAGITSCYRSLMMMRDLLMERDGGLDESRGGSANTVFVRARLGCADVTRG
jgi:ATP-dependent DNA helicase RecG